MRRTLSFSFLLFVLLLPVKIFAAAEFADHRLACMPGDTLPKDSVVIAVDSAGSHAIFQGKENQKLIAAVLAFPLPFGILGLHRIYLGTDPWVPVAYIVTLGGFGVLALSDFIAIVLADEAELKDYKNNGKIFMWVK
jgi:TM2 domain-containing membrane protein YozV